MNKSTPVGPLEGVMEQIKYFSHKIFESDWSCIFCKILYLQRLKTRCLFALLLNNYTYLLLLIILTDCIY